jgi:hypothetical protein
MFRRIQVGVKSKGTDWVVLGRGFGQDVPDKGGLKGYGTSEVAMRNQYTAWADYLCEER